MEKFQTSDIPKTERIQRLVDHLYEHMPVIESARAKLLTESYKATENEPIITRRAKAFAHILRHIQNNPSRLPLPRYPLLLHAATP